MKARIRGITNRWYIYLWNSKSRKFRKLGTCYSYHQPHALAKAFRRFGTNTDLVVRRWDEKFPDTMLEVG